MAVSEGVERLWLAAELKCPVCHAPKDCALRKDQLAHTEVIHRATRFGRSTMHQLILAEPRRERRPQQTRGRGFRYGIREWAAQKLCLDGTGSVLASLAQRTEEGRSITDEWPLHSGFHMDVTRRAAAAGDEVGSIERRRTA